MNRSNYNPGVWQGVWQGDDVKHKKTKNEMKKEDRLLKNMPVGMI